MWSCTSRIALDFEWLLLRLLLAHRVDDAFSGFRFDRPKPDEQRRSKCCAAKSVDAHGEVITCLMDTLHSAGMHIGHHAERFRSYKPALLPRHGKLVEKVL